MAASAVLVPLAVLSFTDGNGDPLVGGSITYYTPNTTTLATVWGDAAQSLVLQNPVPLDAAGRPQNPSGGETGIYGDAQYLMVVKDYTGGQQWSGLTTAEVQATSLAAPVLVPNIAALRAFNTANVPVVYVEGYYIGADGGDGNFWYNSSDTSSPDNGGTIIIDAIGRRWYREIEIGVVWGRQFGAKGDGTTDDYPSLQAAITYLSGLGTGGGKLCLDTGTFLVNTKLLIDFSGIEIEGCGVGTWIYNGTTNTAAIQVGSGSGQRARNAVRNLAIGQAAGVTPVAGNCGIFCDFCSNVRIVDVTMFQFPAALRDGLIWNQVTQSWIDRVDIQNCLGRGIQFLSSNDIYCANTHSDSNGDSGIYFDGFGGGYFSGVTAYNNTEMGWFIDAVNEGGAQYFCVNCVGDTNGSHNWAVTSCAQMFLANCWGSTQKSRLINTFADGFYFTGSGTRNITMIGCGAFYNNGDGLQFDTAGGVPYNITISGCMFGTDNPANGNGQAASGGYGIVIPPGFAAGALQIIGGQSRGNVTGQVLNGSGTNVSIQNHVGYTTESYGAIGISPNGSGQGTIAHGLAAAPTFAIVGFEGPGSADNVMSTTLGATNLTVTIYNSSTGVPVTSGTFDVLWQAKV